MWRIGCAVLFALGAAHAEPGFQHGVCYAHAWRGAGGYGSAESQRSLERLKKLGVDAISLTPFGYQLSTSSDRILWSNHWGESDEALAAQTRQAHALGMQVILKPHIWIRGGKWIGEQTLPDDAAWARWFASYRAFILHYAELAQAQKMDALVVGTELKQASRRDRETWKQLLGAVRAAYHGTLLYAANWDEADQVVFWDLVDEVGVQEYQPPAERPHPTVAELRAGWSRILQRLQALAQKTRKPIVLTELGYRATADAAAHPAAWPDGSAAYDGDAQADCYRAALEALSGHAWLRGVYIWKWFSDSHDEEGPTDFSPAGKPAEKVLRELYRQLK